MKPNRVQRKAGKIATVAQAGKTPENQSANPPSAPAAIPAVLIDPALAAIEFEDGLEDFRCRMNEAGAMCLMLAANIEWHTKSFSGWEDFDGHPDFTRGLYGCARAAMNNLSPTLADFAALHAPIAARLRNVRESIAPAPRDVEHNDEILSRYNPQFKQAMPNIDDSKNAMAETLELLGVTLYARGGKGRVGYFASELIKKNLEEAHSRLWRAAHSLRRAALAVEFQSERRAAA